MTGKRRLTKSIKGLDVTKLDKPRQVRGILGNTINGNQVVEVPTRPGYVWVRLRDQQSEIIQAFNDDVSPVYDLPVFVTRDSDDPTRYIIVGRDTAQYANWGAGAAYLPRHANQHSFSDDAGAAGDVVWVYGRQFMPMLAYPSGSAGAGNVIISPYTYFSQAQDWVYSGGTGTASIVAYKPTGSNARVVLVYMDTNGNPQLLPGDYFAATITGTSQVIQYLPDLPNNTKPIAAVRLVSGTSIINWSNIYDVRQFYNDSVVAPITPSLGLAIYDDHVFKVTGTAIDFTDNISVAVTGSFVYVSSTGGGGGGSGTGTVGARVYRTQDQLIPRLTGTAIAFTHEHYDTDTIHSGSSTQLYCNTAGYYAIIGNVLWQADNNGTRELYIRLNGSNNTIIGKVKDDVAATTNEMGQSIATIWQLNQGDYVELFAYHGSINGSLVVRGEAGTPNFSTEFMMQRFGDVGSTIISTGTVVVNNTYNTYNANNVLPIFDSGVFKVTGTAVSFDDNLTVIVSGTVAFVSSSAAGGGGLSALPIQDDGSFVVSGTALSFDKDLIVTASGTVAHVEVPAGTFASGSHTHPAGAAAIQIYEDGAYKATGTLIDFQDNLDVFVTGTVAFIKSYGNAVYSVSGTSNPPTEAELISTFGTPDTFHTRKQIGHLNDGDAGVNEYLVVSDGSHYWISTLSKVSTASLSIAGTTGTVEASTAGLWYGRASIEKMSDGNWILAYREGQAHADNGVDVLHLKFSSNEGQTWTNRDIDLNGNPVSGFPMTPPNGGTGTSRGPGEPWLIVAPNNDLLLHMWCIDYDVSNSGTYQSRSTDNGVTWSTPAAIDFSGISGDNNIFMTDDHFIYNDVIYAGARVYDGIAHTNMKSVLIKSSDNGTTWEYVSDISSYTQDTEEVALEYLGNGKILALLRDQNRAKTYKTTSTDMGLTWSALTDIAGTFGIIGRARMQTRSHLKGYNNWWEDKILLVFGHVFVNSGSSHPRRNAVWISQDGGDTWDGPNYVDAQTEDAGYGDMIYSHTLGKYIFITYQGTLAEANLMQYDLSITGI